MEVRQGHDDGRILVQVLRPLDNLGLVLIRRIQPQPFHHFAERSFRPNDGNLVIDGVHGDGDAPVGDVLQHGRAVIQPVTRDRIDLDASVALVNPVAAVAAVIGDNTTDKGTQENPMDVPHDGEVDILE